MGHNEKSWHLVAFEIQLYLQKCSEYSESDGVINLCSNLVKYTTLQLYVTGSCETAFRFVIYLHSLCLGKGAIEGLNAQVY